MEHHNTDALTDFARILGEKVPSSIKEVVKVITEMTAKFTTVVHDLKSEIKALHSSNLAVKAELTSVRASMGFINDSFEEFKSEIRALRAEVNQVKTLTHDL